MTTSDKKPRIAFIGECMIELKKDANGVISESFAGDTLNTALYLARLFSVHQHEVHYITALGTDRFSEAMLEQWQEEGIRCDYVRRLPDKLPGLYYVDVDSSGERSFQYWRGQSAARHLMENQADEPLLESLATFDYIYLSGISLAILPDDGRQKLLELLRHAKTQGAKICFDNNFRPRLWNNPEEAQHWYRQVLQLTDIACLTFDDECLLWNDSSPDQVFDRCRQWGIEEVVLKRGTEPCLIESGASAGRESVEAVKVPEINILDTTAAGDSFSAGYLARRLNGDFLPAQCAALGHRLASTVIQHRGAIIPRDAMSDILKSIDV